MQYVNGKGQVSPIYYTTSDSEGKFVFDLSKAPKDALGNPVAFKLSGDEKFQVRTWAENPDPAKYTLAGGGDMYSGRFHNRLTRKWETWDFTAGINRIVDSRVVFQERPNVDGWLAKPEAEWTEAPAADKKWPEGGNYGTARGKVWWENNEDEGTLSNQYFKDSSDRAATNVKVVGSYVNDEVARQFDAWKAANKNYSREQFRAAQKDIVDKYQAEHGAGSHIAESRVAYVKDDGSFYLPFAGLYGVDRNKKGNKTTDEEWGTLVSAKDEKHDSLMQWNGTLGQRHRHINKDYMYLYPVVGDNRDLWMGNYQDNMFQPADGGGLGESLESDNISQQNFALLTPRPMHDVFNYDNTSSIAAPGDTAKSKTTGLVPNQKYAIEWFADGKSTGKVCTVTANKLGELDSCDFTVPKDLSKATVYSSQVFAADASGNPTGTLLLADSFLADPTVVKDSESFAPEYKDGSGKPGDDATVPAPTIKDKDGKETTAPEGTKFAPGDNAPAGVKVDPDTGEIKVTVPADAKPGDKITVPVVVTYPDGSKDTVDVTVTVDKPDVPAPSIAAGSETDEVPADGSEKALDDKVENPTDGMTGEVLDKDGNPIKGATVTVDPSTGEIKVTVPEGTAPQDGKVVVKDKNGDKVGEVDVKITKPKTDVPDTSNVSVVPDAVTVVEGQEGKPFEVAKNIPEGGKVVVDGLPDGLSVDESTGEVTGTPSTISDWGKDEEERDVEVTVSVTDKDGKEVAQGTKTVTVQRDTDGDGQPDVTDTDDDNDGATDAEEAAAGTDPKDASSKPEAKPGDDQGATSVDKSGVKDVKPSGEDQNTGIKVTNPDEGTNVSATDKNGKDVPAKIDDNGNVVVTPGEDAEGPITVVIEDEDLDGGKTEVEVGVKDEEPGNQGGSSNVPGGSSLPGLSSGSSNVDWERCAPAAAGVGLPLLFLLPIGLASQMNIPGFSPLVKQVSAQIDGINRQLGQQNTALQKQLGIYNGPLAKQASQIDLMLKKVSPEAGRIGGGVALAAAGALALGLLINSCAPGAGSSSSSK